MTARFAYHGVEPGAVRPGQAVSICEGVEARLLVPPSPLSSRGVPIDHPDLPQVAARFSISHSPAIYATCVRGGLLVGQRSILASGRFFNDVSYQYRTLTGGARRYQELFPHEFKKQPHLRQWDDWLEIDPDQAPQAQALPLKSLIVSSTESINFGSWIFRILPKLVLRAKPVFKKYLGDYGGHVVAPADKPWKSDLLARSAPDAAIVCQNVNGVYRLEDAAFLSQPVHNGIFPAWLLESLQELAKDQPVQGSREKKIYVSRRKWSAMRRTRVLRNEAAVEELLAERGFTILYPEEYTFSENACHFANASVIVGPSGAGLFNAVFCRPGTTILEIEQSTTWRSTHANIYRSAGLKFGFLDNRAGQLETNPAGHDNYWTDLPRLAAIVDDLLATGG